MFINPQFLYQSAIDKLFIREEILKDKSKEEKDKLLDRWAIEDAAKEIADAIRSTKYERPKFLGLF